MGQVREEEVEQDNLTKGQKASTLLETQMNANSYEY